ncbi:MAG: DUF4982 domain-containing protein [Prevotella sp.]|jgi:beta-galactosidase|nr:DUF4982 domain-containing protein [Prevotella sp.]
MKHLKIRTVLFLFLFSVSGVAQINYEKKVRLTDGWLFLREDIGNIWEAVRPSKPGSSEEVPAWKTVQLPHCFNAEDAVDPDVNYYQGPGWYKKLLDIENPYTSGRTLLHFEGAGQKTEVYIFTEKVGAHVGGYDEWTLDITDAVNRFLQSGEAKRFDGKIPLNIRCDNSRDAEMLPSDLSDFNLYGGLYRYLNLVYTPALALNKVQVNASTDVGGKKGLLSIDAGFDVHSAVASAVLNVKIYDPQGNVVKETSETLTAFDRQEALSLEINKPVLWSPDSPKLYSCELMLTSAEGTMTCKELFGFRHFEFVEKGPFMLNGKRLLIRGTHRHEDHAGLAAAMPEDLIVEEMQMMKDMGVNFIRLAHYQQSRIVLEQCDKLGILVWEEIPWCRGGLGGESYRTQAKRMLENMIAQHRNHPAVILWGLGNENDWPNDFPTFDKDAIRSFMKELHNLAHRLDNTRLTCIRRCDFCKDIVDVYSPSIWAGWYRGLYTDYKTVAFDEMQRVKRFLHVEWGGDSHALRHAENTYEGLENIKSEGHKADEREGDASLYGGIARASRDSDWSETYICDLIDWHLKEQETMTWLSGAAYWPFKDFSTPVRPENPVPYMNQKGVVERDLTKKEAYYVFQSYWTDEPMAHIYGHTWPIRWGKTGEKRMLKVYSNCGQVELFLNGKSMGVKKRNSQDFPAAGLRWEVIPVEGKNTVKAVATKGKGKNAVSVEDEITFDYQVGVAGKEAAIVLKATDAEDDNVWVEAELRDENALVCLTSRNYIRFDSTGDGELLVNRGTSTGSKYVQAYNGRAKVKLRKNSGKTVVSVKSEGLKTAFINID